MNWNMLWLKLFGTTTLWGLNMGFWVSLGTVLLIVILMNALFWSLKPAPRSPRKGALILTEKIKRH